MQSGEKRIIGIQELIHAERVLLWWESVFITILLGFSENGSFGGMRSRCLNYMPCPPARAEWGGWGKREVVDISKYLAFEVT